MMSLLAVVIVTEQSQRKDLAAAPRYVSNRQHLVAWREAVELYYYTVLLFLKVETRWSPDSQKVVGLIPV